MPAAKALSFFVCEDCGSVQISKTEGRWTVFPVVPCECGGNFLPSLMLEPKDLDEEES